VLPSQFRLHRGKGAREFERILIHFLFAIKWSLDKGRGEKTWDI